MARYRDSSPHPADWTNRKLMAEAMKYANLESFSVGFFDGPETTFRPGWHNQQQEPKGPTVDDFCRQQTRLYRATWLQPVLEEIERRFVKVPA